MIRIPEEKRIKALNQIQWILSKKKATVRELQQLAGTLNFLCKAIHPGRVFVRRMYAKFTFEHELNTNKKRTSTLKPFHHVKLDCEFKLDCKIWEQFLLFQNSVNRPFTDYNAKYFNSDEIEFYTDASLNRNLGFGCFFPPGWSFGKWEPRWVQDCAPSIAYVELFALVIGIFMWEERLRNSNFTIFCDNKSVRDMVNANTSGCKNCMLLLRKLTLNNLKFNRKIKVEYVESSKNYFADSLSRLKLKEFFDKAEEKEKQLDNNPTALPNELWPVSNIFVPNIQL